MLDSRCREIVGGVESPPSAAATGVVAAVGVEVHSIAVWRVGNVFFRGEADILQLGSVMYLFDTMIRLSPSLLSTLQEHYPFDKVSR